MKSVLIFILSDIARKSSGQASYVDVFLLSAIAVCLLLAAIGI